MKTGREGEEREREVVAWLAEFLAVAPAKVKLEARIAQDLGVDGDDAEELMQAFAARFEVALDDFEFDRHFAQEGAGNPMCYVAQVFREDELVPVRVRDFVRAAESGRWIR